MPPYLLAVDEEAWENSWNSLRSALAPLLRCAQTRRPRSVRAKAIAISRSCRSPWTAACSGLSVTLDADHPASVQLDLDTLPALVLRHIQNLACQITVGKTKLIQYREVVCL